MGIEEKLARGGKSEQLFDGFGGVCNCFGDVLRCLGDAYNSLLWGCAQLTAEFSFLPQDAFYQPICLRRSCHGGTASGGGRWGAGFGVAFPQVRSRRLLWAASLSAPPRGKPAPFNGNEESKSGSVWDLLTLC